MAKDKRAKKGSPPNKKILCSAKELCRIRNPGLISDKCKKYSFYNVDNAGYENVPRCPLEGILCEGISGNGYLEPPFLSDRAKDSEVFCVLIKEGYLPANSR